MQETPHSGARLVLSSEISSFLDYCRVEKGLATNTLEAYSRDLKAFAAFRKPENGIPELEDLRLYLDSLYKTGLGSRSIARHLATLRNFYRFLASDGKIVVDPTERLVAPKQWQNIPKFLNREQIDKLLAAPDIAKPTGVRDRAMLELLYATGLRVSELCGVRIADLQFDAGVLRKLTTQASARGLETGVLRTIGKGNKQRLTPVGKSALAAVRGPAEIAVRPCQPLSVRDGARWTPHAASLLEAVVGAWKESRYFPGFDSSRNPAQLRNPPSGRWSGPAERTDDARSCRHLHDADLHARHAVETAADNRAAPSTGMSGKRVQ